MEYEDFRRQCAGAGLKATPQRLAIYRVLEGSTAHPDAETVCSEVRRQVPSVALDTVYRNLKVMDERGLLQKVGATEYRTRYDAQTRPHPHFVCTRCGRIDDVDDEALTAIPVPEGIPGIGRVEQHYVELRGVCTACSEEE